MDRQYVAKIVLELQPRSLRGVRGLFGIRENKSFNIELFDRNHFTQVFLEQYNKKTLQRGQHIECDHLIVAVKEIQRIIDKFYYNRLYQSIDIFDLGADSTFLGNTELEFRLKGIPLQFQEKKLLLNKSLENLGTLNASFIGDRSSKNCSTNTENEVKHVYSCHCSECKKRLTEGDFYIKTGNWSRPIVCLSCYDVLFTEKCARCGKSITFDHNSITADGLASVRFVKHNGFYWHSECCVCITCLQSLVGQKFYQDETYNQLFCLEHMPTELE